MFFNQVIGHEITHGFDDQGREYDADGNMRSWWTKLALDGFEERTKCFVQQYSSYALDGQSENGQRTLSNFNSIIRISENLFERYMKQVGSLDRPAQTSRCVHIT